MFDRNIALEINDYRQNLGQFIPVRQIFMVSVLRHSIFIHFLKTANKY